MHQNILKITVAKFHNRKGIGIKEYIIQVSDMELLVNNVKNAIKTLYEY